MSSVVEWSDYEDSPGQIKERKWQSQGMTSSAQEGSENQGAAITTLRQAFIFWELGTQIGLKSNGLLKLQHKLNSYFVFFLDFYFFILIFFIYFY